MNFKTKALNDFCRLVMTPTLLILFSPSISADDWPRRQGPSGNGISSESGYFSGEATPELRELWRQSIGRGFSEISVAGERAFTLAGRGDMESAVAFDVADGEILWRVDLDDDGDPFGPYATPLVAGERVVALSSGGILQALDAASGKSLWRRDLPEEFGASSPAYGFSTSPMTLDDLIVVLVGGKENHNLTAFDAATGEAAWSVHHANLGSYASPLPTTLNGIRQIVVPAGDRMYGLSRDGRDLLWSQEIPFPERTPIFLPEDRIFLPLETTAVLWQLEKDENSTRAVEKWRSDVFTNSYTEVIHHEGVLYGFRSHTMMCVDPASGEILWQQRIEGGGALILVEDHLIMLDNQGAKLRLIAADRERFRQILEVDAFVKRRPPPSPFMEEPAFASPSAFHAHGEEAANDDPVADVAMSEPSDEGNRDSTGSLTAPSFSAGRIFLRNQSEALVFEVATPDAGK